MKLQYYKSDIRVAFIQGAMHALGEAKFLEHGDRIRHEANKYADKEEERQRMMMQDV